jgi:hypothetical protein
MIETCKVKKKKKNSAADARKDARIGLGQLPAAGVIFAGHCFGQLGDKSTGW